MKHYGSNGGIVVPTYTYAITPTALTPVIDVWDNPILV